MGRHLELDDTKAMRKSNLVRTIAEHMVYINIFEEEILNQLLIDVQEMYQAQIELEKASLTTN